RAVPPAGDPYLHVGLPVGGREPVRVAVLGLHQPVDALHAARDGRGVVTARHLGVGHLRGPGDTAPQYDRHAAPARGQFGRGFGIVALLAVHLVRQDLVQVPAQFGDLRVRTGNRHGRAVVCRGAARDGEQRDERGQDGEPVTEGLHRLRVDGGYRWTTGQVRVRVMPSTCWTLATTMRPRPSTVSAWSRTITSYGPVTSSAWMTPGILPIRSATVDALPTSVWIRMYACTTEPPQRPRGSWGEKERHGIASPLATGRPAGTGTCAPGVRQERS